MKTPWFRTFEALLPAIGEFGYSWQCVSLIDWVVIWWRGGEVRRTSRGIVFGKKRGRTK